MSDSISAPLAGIRKIYDAIRASLGKRWLRILAAACLASIPMVIVFLTYPVAYRGGDDYTIAATLDGSFTGSPQFIHRYVGVLWSYSVGMLYKLFPSVPWHAVCMHVVVWLSATAVVWAFITLSLRKQKSLALPAFSYIAVSLSLLTVASGQLDFTRTASCAAVAAIAVMMTADFKNRKKTAITLCISALYLMISAALRYSATKPLLILFVCLAVGRALFAFFSDRKGNRSGAVTALVATLCIASLIYASNRVSENIKYKAEGASDLALASQISKYNDYPHKRYSESKELYDSIGWSESYYSLVAKWCFLDGKVNAGAMDTINGANIFNSARSNLLTAAKDFISYYKVGLNKHTAGVTSILICVIAAIVSLVVFIRAVFGAVFLKIEFRKFACSLIALAGTWLLYISSSMYLFYNGKVSEHAFFGIAGALLVVALSILCGAETVQFPPRKLRTKKAAGRVFSSFALALLAISVIFPAYSASQVIYNNKLMDRTERRKNDCDAIAEYVNENSDNIYIAEHEVYVKMIDAYGDTRIDNCNFSAWGNSTYSTRASRSVFIRHGKEYLSSASFFDDVYFMAETGCDYTLLNYMRETYGEDVEPVVTYTDPENSFVVYHFERTGG